jgi:hypothetical protein
MYSTIETMSTQKDYRRCLERLAAEAPRRKAVLIRSLLPEIQAALKSGQTLKDIWEALETEGLEVSYHTFHMAVWRARRKPTAPNTLEKQDETAPSREHGGPMAEMAETRDPLANLKRLEEDRPGFQWRGTQKLQRLVHGTENSNDKSER